MMRNKPAFRLIVTYYAPFKSVGVGPDIMKEVYHKPLATIEDVVSEMAMALVNFEPGADYCELNAAYYQPIAITNRGSLVQAVTEMRPALLIFSAALNTAEPEKWIKIWQKDAEKTMERVANPTYYKSQWKKINP